MTTDPHAGCTSCRPRSTDAGPIPGTPVALPDLADVTALPTAMCTAEDETRDLGCSLPAAHDGPHADLTGTEDGAEPSLFLTPDQYDDHTSDRGSTWDGGNPAGGGLEPLPETLTSGLTVWGAYGGAQIRLESALLTDDNGDLVLDDNGDPQVIPAPPIGCLYLAFDDNCPRSPEIGEPYRLNLTEARALRDLLNTATARGAL